MARASSPRLEATLREEPLPVRRVVEAPGDFVGLRLCSRLPEPHLERVAVEERRDLPGAVGHDCVLEPLELLVDEGIGDPHPTEVHRGRPSRLQLDRLNPDGANELLEFLLRQGLVGYDRHPLMIWIGFRPEHGICLRGVRDRILAGLWNCGGLAAGGQGGFPREPRHFG